MDSKCKGGFHIRPQIYPPKRVILRMGMKPAVFAGRYETRPYYSFIYGPEQ